MKLHLIHDWNITYDWSNDINKVRSQLLGSKGKIIAKYLTCQTCGKTKINSERI